MKKRIYLLGLISLLVSCNSTSASNSSGVQQNLSPKIIVPNGTPTLGIANYAVNHMDNVEVVAGPKLLSAAFASKDKDIIIAPINLGVTRYNTDTSYSLYRTLVWDNIYLVSRSEITTLNDLANQKITSFGKSSTPEIILNTILSTSNLTDSVEVEYLDNVTMANSMFVDGSRDIIITAQPNLSLIDTSNSYVTPLNKFWKEATNLDSYPQSGIFVKTSEYDELKTALSEIDQAIAEISQDVAKSAKNGEIVTNNAFKEDVLLNAIPLCGYKTFDNEKSLLEGYFRIMIDKGMGSSIGGKLPDEAFYLKK